MVFNESELIIGLRKGDNSSYTQAYHRYSSMVMNLAYRMLGRREEAEDIVQQTFFQLFRSIGEFRGDCTLSTWVYTIAKNLCLQQLRKTTPKSFENFEQLIQRAQHESVSQDISEMEKGDCIRQVKEGCLLGLLQCLPVQQRLAFVLHLLLKLDLKMVAAIIGKTDNATRILIHRARHHLKKFLCRQCSWYQKNNPCRCENLISFSLKNGWIERCTNREPMLPPKDLALRVEEEINSLKKIVVFYDSLQNQPPPALIDAIRSLTMNEDLLIFSSKKVK